MRPGILFGNVPRPQVCIPWTAVLPLIIWLGRPIWVRLPPAYQVAAPFGTNIGPTNPAFFGINPDAEFDSFITIGMDGPALVPGALSSIGIDFNQWDESAGISTDNGAVFYLDPSHGAEYQPVLVAQLTQASIVF